jgi:A/G-specific adenine glycosylase
VASGTTDLAERRHTFSHFRLRIRPTLIELAGRQCGAGESGTAWVTLEAAQHYALPAPVRAILASLDE